MALISRYTTSNLVNLLDEIYRSDKFISTPFYTSNSRFVSVSENLGKLEVELAGYSKDEIEVYTEKDFLYVKASKSEDSSARKYYRSWPIAENERIGVTKYENGLLSIEILKIVPEQQRRKNYKID
jgi:HSP20 family molecular chaperone IbpA